MAILPRTHEALFVWFFFFFFKVIFSTLTKSNFSLEKIRSVLQ